MIRWFLLFASFVLITSCSSISSSKPSPSATASAASPLTHQQSKPPNVVFLNDKVDDPIKANILQIINQSIRYLNDRNKRGYMSLSVQNEAAYDHYVNVEDEYVLSVSEPQFDQDVIAADRTSIAVTVHRMTQSIRGEEDRTSIYAFTKIEGEWKIAGIEG